MPVIYKSKGDYIPFVDLYGASTLDLLKTNLLLKVFQKTKDKYCNFKFGCGWNDETWGSGVYYGTSIVVSTTTNNREFFIVFYPNESSPGLTLLGTAYLLDGRTPVYIRYIERDGVATWHIENVNKNENNICQTIVGSKNYTGHQINSGEYFIANGEKYKATAAIPNGSSWQGSATAVSDHDLISALNNSLSEYCHLCFSEYHDNSNWDYSYTAPLDKVSLLIITAWPYASDSGLYLIAFTSGGGAITTIKSTGSNTVAFDGNCRKIKIHIATSWTSIKLIDIP